MAKTKKTTTRQHKPRKVASSSTPSKSRSTGARANQSRDLSRFVDDDKVEYGRVSTTNGGEMLTIKLKDDPRAQYRPEKRKNEAGDVITVLVRKDAPEDIPGAAYRVEKRGGKNYLVRK